MALLYNLAMSASNIHERLLALRDELNRGSLVLVRRKLLGLRLGAIPRRDLWLAASLAQRSGVPELGLRMLYPIVRDPEGIQVADARELTEYAGCLVDRGALREAASLLNSAKVGQVPKAMRFRALLLMRAWDWSAAVPLLKRYVESSSLNELENLKGRLLLAAALIHGPGDFEGAIKCLDQAESHPSASVTHNRFGILQTRAQAELLGHQHAAGVSRLRKLEAELSPGGRTFIHVRMREFLALAEFWKDGNTRLFRRQSLQAARDFEQIGHFEFARAALYRCARLTQDLPLLLKLFFGTPHEAFRRRWSAECESLVSLPDEFLWSPASSGRAPANSKWQIELRGGGTADSKHYLKSGQLLHRLLSVLSQDFFCPHAEAELFEKLYPGEYYHPATSPLKMRQAFFRLRQWLSRAGIPLEIEAIHGAFRLAATDPAVVLRVPSPRQQPGAALLASTYVRKLDRLLAAVGPERHFSAREASRILRISNRSARRTLEKGIGSALLNRSGAGPAAVYRFTKSSEQSRSR